MSTPVPRRPRRRRRLLAALAVVFVVFAALSARLFVWPALPALPPHADAVVELGGPGERRPIALDLVRSGRAPMAAISVSYAEADTTWCYEGRLHDIPVSCFHPDPYTTRGEARAVADMARERGWHSVILVTTPDQASRAILRVSRCFHGQIYVATARLPLHEWPGQIAYQWGATAKAYTLETSC